MDKSWETTSERIPSLNCAKWPQENHKLSIKFLQKSTIKPSFTYWYWTRLSKKPLKILICLSVSFFHNLSLSWFSSYYNEPSNFEQISFNLFTFSHQIFDSICSFFLLGILTKYIFKLLFVRQSRINWQLVL